MLIGSKLIEGKELFTFGKYKGKSVKFILQTDPKYFKKITRIFSKLINKELLRLNLKPTQNETRNKRYI